MKLNYSVVKALKEETSSYNDPSWKPSFDHEVSFLGR